MPKDASQIGTDSDANLGCDTEVLTHSLAPHKGTQDQVTARCSIKLVKLSQSTGKFCFQDGRGSYTLIKEEHQRYKIKDIRILRSGNRSHLKATSRMNRRFSPYSPASSGIKRLSSPPGGEYPNNYNYNRNIPNYNQRGRGGGGQGFDPRRQYHQGGHFNNRENRSGYQGSSSYRGNRSYSSDRSGTFRDRSPDRGRSRLGPERGRGRRPSPDRSRDLRNRNISPEMGNKWSKDPSPSTRIKDSETPNKKLHQNGDVPRGKALLPTPKCPTEKSTDNNTSGKEAKDGKLASENLNGKGPSTSVTETKTKNLEKESKSKDVLTKVEQDKDARTDQSKIKENVSTEPSTSIQSNITGSEKAKLDHAQETKTAIPNHIAKVSSSEKREASKAAEKKESKETKLNIVEEAKQETPKTSSTVPPQINTSDAFGEDVAKSTEKKEDKKSVNHEPNKCNTEAVRQEIPKTSPAVSKKNSSTGASSENDKKGTEDKKAEEKKSEIKRTVSTPSVKAHSARKSAPSSALSRTQRKQMLQRQKELKAQLSCEEKDASGSLKARMGSRSSSIDDRDSDGDVEKLEIDLDHTGDGSSSDVSKNETVKAPTPAGPESTATAAVPSDTKEHEQNEHVSSRTGESSKDSSEMETKNVDEKETKNLEVSGLSDTGKQISEKPSLNPAKLRAFKENLKKNIFKGKLSPKKDLDVESSSSARSSSPDVLDGALESKSSGKPALTSDGVPHTEVDIPILEPSHEVDTILTLPNVVSDLIAQEMVEDIYGSAQDVETSESLAKGPKLPNADACTSIEPTVEKEKPVLDSTPCLTSPDLANSAQKLSENSEENMDVGLEESASKKVVEDNVECIEPEAKKSKQENELNEKLNEGNISSNDDLEDIDLGSEEPDDMEVIDDDILLEDEAPECSPQDLCKTEPEEDFIEQPKSSPLEDLSDQSKAVVENNYIDQSKIDTDENLKQVSTTIPGEDLVEQSESSLEDKLFDQPKTGPEEDFTIPVDEFAIKSSEDPPEDTNMNSYFPKIAITRVESQAVDVDTDVASGDISGIDDGASNVVSGAGDASVMGEPVPAEADEEAQILEESSVVEAVSDDVTSAEPQAVTDSDTIPSSEPQPPTSKRTLSNDEVQEDEPVSKRSKANEDVTTIDDDEVLEMETTKKGALEESAESPSASDNEAKVVLTQKEWDTFRSALKHKYEKAFKMLHDKTAELSTQEEQYRSLAQQYEQLRKKYDVLCTQFKQHVSTGRRSVHVQTEGVKGKALLHRARRQNSTQSSTKESKESNDEESSSSLSNPEISLEQEISAAAAASSSVPKTSNVETKRQNFQNVLNKVLHKKSSSTSEQSTESTGSAESVGTDSKTAASSTPPLSKAKETDSDTANATKSDSKNDGPNADDDDVVLVQSSETPKTNAAMTNNSGKAAAAAKHSTASKAPPSDITKHSTSNTITSSTTQQAASPSPTLSVIPDPPKPPTAVTSKPSSVPPLKPAEKGQTLSTEHAKGSESSKSATSEKAPDASKIAGPTKVTEPSLSSSEKSSDSAKTSVTEEVIDLTDDDPEPSSDSNPSGSNPKKAVTPQSSRHSTLTSRSPHSLVQTTTATLSKTVTSRVSSSPQHRVASANSPVQRGNASRSSPNAASPSKVSVSNNSHVTGSTVRSQVVNLQHGPGQHSVLSQGNTTQVGAGITRQPGVASVVPRSSLQIVTLNNPQGQTASTVQRLTSPTAVTSSVQGLPVASSVHQRMPIATASFVQQRLHQQQQQQISLQLLQQQRQGTHQLPGAAATAAALAVRQPQATWINKPLLSSPSQVPGQQSLTAAQLQAQMLKASAQTVTTPSIQTRPVQQVPPQQQQFLARASAQEQIQAQQRAHALSQAQAAENARRQQQEQQQQHAARQAAARMQSAQINQQQTQSTQLRKLHEEKQKIQQQGQQYQHRARMLKEQIEKLKAFKRKLIAVQPKGPEKTTQLKQVQEQEKELNREFQTNEEKYRMCIMQKNRIDEQIKLVATSGIAARNHQQQQVVQQLQPQRPQILPPGQQQQQPREQTTSSSAHPAPLPNLRYVLGLSANVLLTQRPLRPVLEIRHSDEGIVLSWKMDPQETSTVRVKQYLLYAYQESESATPSTGLWQKIGEVDALPLPMACTLTHFKSGSMYHFAVCAINIHGCPGDFSNIGSINLP